MKKSNLKENNFIKICKKYLAEKNYISFSEEEFSQLNKKIIDEILDKFAGKCLIRLPDSEIKFFEWLKENDYSVWLDIWANENLKNDIENKNETAENTNNFDEIYLVSINLLPILLNLDGRGLPICDLQNMDNFFFTVDNIIGQEANILVEASRELFKNRKSLTVAQMLALEISLEPIDIWHFAYKHKIELETAKNAVFSLVQDNVLVHLKEAEYIVPFIHF